MKIENNPIKVLARRKPASPSLALQRAEAVFPNLARLLLVELAEGTTQAFGTNIWQGNIAIRPTLTELLSSHVPIELTSNSDMWSRFRPLTARAAAPWTKLSRLERRHLSMAYNVYEPAKDNYDVSGKPIVIMHGLFGSKQNNRSISKVLARDLGVPVYAVDLRNHGHSPHDSEHNYNVMAADVEEFLDEHDLPSATLIGHSMGAKVAMAVALQAPQRVSSLVPVDNAPVDAMLKSDFHKYVQAMRKIAEAGLTKQSEADDILQEYEKSLAIRQFLLTNLIRDTHSQKLVFRVPLKVLGNALDYMGDFPYKDPQAIRYKGPALFIRGTKSHYIADDVLPLIGQFFPAFKLADVDSGHWVISEQPEAFRKIVVDFLQRTE